MSSPAHHSRFLKLREMFWGAAPPPQGADSLILPLHAEDWQSLAQALCHGHGWLVFKPFPAQQRVKGPQKCLTKVKV